MIHFQAVANIANARGELLSGFFVLLTLLIFVGHIQQNANNPNAGFGTIFFPTW
jgi:hypothetical protein